MFGQRRISGAILTDLSKSFDCIFLELLIAKLPAYGFDHQSLRIMDSFLSMGLERTKFNNYFRRYSEIIFGVPHGSILGPFPFNIYIYDIFFDIIECDIASYANVKLDSNLSFENHVVSLCKNSSQKLHALARISH